MFRVALLGVLLTACATAKKPDEEPAPLTPPPTKPKPRNWSPPEPGNDKWDWVRLTSGEWLKGEITVVRDRKLQFDSDELDELTVKWHKVTELRSPRKFTVVLGDGTYATGTFLLKGDQIVVKTDEQTVALDREKITSIVPGDPETGFWSGKFTLGLNVRSGNVNQQELTSYLLVNRRSPKSLLELTFRGYYGELEGEVTADNQRLTFRWDLFLGYRLFITPASLELYRDPFTNIGLRTTPSAGVGYQLLSKQLDKRNMDLRVFGGLAYRNTEFESGPVGRDTTAAGVLGVTWEWDITSDIELRLDYQAQVGIPDTQDTNQHLGTTISFDLFKNLDLDFTLVWDRVGKPRPDSEGEIPEKDDYRLSIGIGWDF